MKTNFPTESMIRQYLLGRLDDQDQLESSLSEQMLFDEELSETVDSIEDELIEDYLDGALNDEDRKAAEEYFLRPPERKEKLRFARLLRNRFEKKHAAVAKKTLDVAHEPVRKLTNGGSGSWLALHWLSHRRTYCELAVLILLSVAGLIYVSHVRSDLQSQIETTRKTETQLAAELVQEREHSASLAKQLQEARPPVVLSFLGPLFRDNPGTQVIEIRPWTERIKVSIDLQSASSRDYDVRLENRSKQTLWAQAHLARSSNGLFFEMPAQSIPTTGVYCLVVSSRPEPYCFQARVIKN